MRGVIDDFVRRLGVTVILDRKVVSGVIDIFYYNFIGSDKRFYSLLVPCNETQILLSPQKHLTVSDFIGIPENEECTDLMISRNLRVFNTKEDWVTGKWKIENARAVDKKLRKYLDECLIDYCEVGNYRLVSHRLWLRPAVGLSILYDELGKGTKSFSIWHGCKTELPDTDGLRLFVKELGLEKHIVWNGECNDSA